MNVEKFALVTNGLALAGRESDLRNAQAYLEKQMKSADDVVVVSAYYGEEFIKGVLQRACVSGRGRRLTLVFAGLPDVALDTQVESLRLLKDDIVATHRYAARNVDVRLIINTKFLHAKVVRFRAQNRLPVYLIGSANFSDAAYRQNDEAMIAIKGRHPGLNSYIQHILESSLPILDIQCDRPAHSWREFLRNGFLYFRPTRTIGYSIDPFADEELKSIATCLRQQILNPLPFSDKNVLGLNLAELLKIEQPSDAKLGFRLPTYAIETDYGYWVPKHYVDFIEEKLEKAAAPKRAALEKRGKELAALGDDYVSTQVQIYLDEVQSRLANGDPPRALTKRQRGSIEAKIVRRIKHLKTLLTDEKALDRLSKTMIGAPVPEFWEDEASVARFFEGFCYDVVSKLTAPRRVPGIVAHLAYQFDIAHGDDITACGEKIMRFFEDGGLWEVDNWPTVSKLEEETA